MPYFYNIQDINNGSLLFPAEPHLVIVLLLDTSSSMTGEAINNLNKAINNFLGQVMTEDTILKTLDIAIVGFGDSAYIVQDFVPFPLSRPITLWVNNCTAMGEGINLAIDKVKERKCFYAKMGISYYEPWIFMITDGVPTDDISLARRRIIEEENRKRFKFCAVGTPGYDKGILTSLTKRCMALDKTDFENFFEWLICMLEDIPHAWKSPKQNFFELPGIAPELPSIESQVEIDWE